MPAVCGEGDTHLKFGRAVSEDTQVSAEFEGAQHGVVRGEQDVHGAAECTERVASQLRLRKSLTVVSGLLATGFRADACEEIQAFHGKGGLSQKAFFR